MKSIINMFEQNDDSLNCNLNSKSVKLCKLKKKKKKQFK